MGQLTKVLQGGEKNPNSKQKENLWQRKKKSEKQKILWKDIGYLNSKYIFDVSLQTSCILSFS